MKTRTKGRSCDGKHRHDTKAEAERHIGSLVSRHLAARSRVHAYRCGFCGGWHVGHTR